MTSDMSYGKPSCKWCRLKSNPWQKLVISACLLSLINWVAMPFVSPFCRPPEGVAGFDRDKRRWPGGQGWIQTVVYRRTSVTTCPGLDLVPQRVSNREYPGCSVGKQCEQGTLIPFGLTYTLLPPETSQCSVFVLVLLLPLESLQCCLHSQC